MCNQRAVISLFLLVLFFSVSAANAGIRKTSEEARIVEQQLTSCTGNEQQIINCVQQAIEDYGVALSQGFPQKAPKVSGIVKNAAIELKKAKSKASALSVLNRARATLRLVAARRSGEAKEIYQRVALTLSKALRVIKRRA